MAIRADTSIDLKIVEMKQKGNAGLHTIMKYLQSWDSFKFLDEQIILAHILNVFKDNKISVTKNQIKYCFDKNYNLEFHQLKQGYLSELYKLAYPSQKVGSSAVRTAEDTPLLQDSDNSCVIPCINENGGVFE